MNKFEYLAPESVDQAISLHELHGDRAKYIAGGTDVVVKINEDKLTPDYLISLKHIPDLNRLVLDEESGELRIGALVTHRMLERSTDVRKRYPIIYDAVRNIGSTQIRNVATIGGNLVNAVPSADGAIPLIALDAHVTIRGPGGERSVDLIDFFLSPGRSVLEMGEVLTEIIIPPLPAHTGCAYIKFGRRKAMELPLLGVGVALSLGADLAMCDKARICLGVAAPTPMRAKKAEEFLMGKPVDEEILTEAGEIAAGESRVRDSVRGKAWYRREMVRVQVKRMGLKCVERVKRKSDL